MILGVILGFAVIIFSEIYARLRHKGKVEKFEITLFHHLEKRGGKDKLLNIISIYIDPHSFGDDVVIDAVNNLVAKKIVKVLDSQGIEVIEELSYDCFEKYGDNIVVIFREPA